MNLEKKVDEILEDIKDLKNEVKGLLEINQRLIHERLGVPPPPPPEDKEQKKKKKDIMEINLEEDSKISISGGLTYDYKDTIKKTGKYKFDGPSKSWILDHSNLEALLTNFEELGLEESKDFINNAPVYKEEEEDKGFGNI